MPRVTNLKPSLACGPALAVFSLLIVKICLPHSAMEGVAAAAVLIGVAGGAGSNFLFTYFSEKARSSSEVASEQLREVVDNLQRESSRLEAILGSMVEGVVAVDPMLRITFLNRAFAGTMEVQLPLEARTPLVQVVRDHDLLEMFNAVFTSGEPLQKRLILSAGGARALARSDMHGAGRPHHVCTR